MADKRPSQDGPMSEVVNLTRVRKARARQERQVQAAANRVLYGRSKADRAKAAKEADAADRSHEGKRLDD